MEKKNITNQICTFQLHQRKRFPTRSNLFVFQLVKLLLSLTLGVASQNMQGWNAGKNREMGSLPGICENKRSRKGFNYHKRGSNCHVNLGTAVCGSAEGEKHCFSQSQKTHSEDRLARQRDTIWTVPLLSCRSIPGSTQELKLEVLRLFGWGAWVCNWPCKGLIPLDQTHVRWVQALWL